MKMSKIVLWSKNIGFSIIGAVLLIIISGIKLRYNYFKEPLRIPLAFLLIATEIVVSFVAIVWKCKREKDALIRIGIIALSIFVWLIVDISSPTSNLTPVWLKQFLEEIGVANNSPNYTQHSLPFFPYYLFTSMLGGRYWVRRKMKKQAQQANHPKNSTENISTEL